jgi:hypothetical protein
MTIVVCNFAPPLLMPDHAWEAHYAEDENEDYMNCGYG